MSNIKEIKEILEREINSSDQVFIVVHNGIDFDAIASAIGINLITKKLTKPTYVIIEDNPLKMDAGVKKIIEEMSGVLKIINIDKYLSLKSDNDLLICADVNNSELICCNNYLDNYKKIIIIDHHKENSKTIDTEYKFIDDKASSASEIITELLLQFKIKFGIDIANYLLSGIYLDTNKYTKNCPPKTMRIVSKLHDRGADTKKVNDYFIEDYYSDRKVQNLVNKAKFFTYTIAYCIEDEDVIYTKEELAKVADYLLRYKTDATFAAGFIDDELISISARSKGNVDVSQIMDKLGGGGNVYSGASKINDTLIDNVSKKLEKSIKPPFYIESN